MKLPNAPDGVPDDFAKMLDTMFEMIALASRRTSRAWRRS